MSPEIAAGSRSRSSSAGCARRTSSRPGPVRTTPPPARGADDRAGPDHGLPRRPGERTVPGRVRRAGALPYVYLAVAAIGVAVSPRRSLAAQRRPFARTAVDGCRVICHLPRRPSRPAGWSSSRWDGLWVTFPLLVLFPLSIPIGFVLVGTQAGRLLDVRQMKAHFPRIAAGFSVGFALGGLAAALLVSPLGGPRNLLAVDVLAAGLDARPRRRDLAPVSRRAPRRAGASRPACPVPGHRHSAQHLALAPGQPDGGADPELPAAVGCRHPARWTTWCGSAPPTHYRGPDRRSRSSRDSSAQ